MSHTQPVEATSGSVGADVGVGVGSVGADVGVGVGSRVGANLNAISRGAGGRPFSV
jgi:hypothetical protein